MILLVDEVKKRTEYLRQYLDNITYNLNKKKYRETLQYISNQRQSIQHTNVSKYNPNTFLIDSLKTKKQKLQQQIESLNYDKNIKNDQIKKINSNCAGVQTVLKQQKVMTAISKIQLTIKDAKKVQFDQMTLISNFQHLQLVDFQGKMTKIQLNKIFFIDKKHCILNIHAYCQSHNQNVYIIFKFDNEYSVNKWLNCLNFGKILQQSKMKRYLFMTAKDKHDVEPLVFSSNQPLKGRDIVSEDSELGFLSNNPGNKANYRNTFMPDNSLKNKSQILQNNFYNERSSFVPQNPFQSSHQRTLTSSFLFDKKQNNYTSKRPEALNGLNRMRGKSMYFQFNSGKNYHQYRRQKQQQFALQKNSNDFFNQNSKNYIKPQSKINYRKASEDITLRPKQASDHQKKLQRFRSQRNLIQDILSQSHNKVKKSNPAASSNSKRVQSQIQKKNQMLQRNRNLYKSTFLRLDHHNQNENTKYIEQNSQQNQQLHSQKNSKQSNKRSKFYQEEQYTLSQTYQNEEKKEHYDNNSNVHVHIDEVSQSYQLSPTFPNKIVYEQGPHIRLYPVQTSQKYQKQKQKNNRNSSYNQSQQNQYVEPLNLNNLNNKHNNQQSSQQGIYYNERINTLDSQTDKQHQFHESNSQDHQEELFQQLLDQLKKGLVLTKCSQNSFWTREKQIKLSENQNTLLIIDVKDKKIKKIPIGDIFGIQYSKYGKGIIKHIPQIQQRKCLVLSTQQGKQIKKQEFIGNNPQKLQLYANNLNYYVQRFKAS